MLLIYQILSDQKYLKLSEVITVNELKLISQQLGINNPRQILYHAKYDIANIPSCKCGNKLEWNADKREYRVYCSKKCTTTFSIDKRIATSIKKYGTSFPSQNSDVKQKAKDTSMVRFQTDHYSKTKEFKDSVTATNLEKFGTKTPFENQQVRDNFKKYCIETYGVENPAMVDDVKSKMKNTNLLRYGVENPLKNSQIRDKVKETNLKKYGVPNPLQNTQIHSRGQLTRKHNHFSLNTIEKLDDPTWLSNANANGLSIGQIAADLKISPSQLGKYYAKYGIEIKRHYHSSEEKSITNILDEYGIAYIKNDRKQIHPYELDIYIPDYQLAIEINGGYWHHEGQGKDQYYHLNKTKLCDLSGIELWHFFDWEIHHQIDIVKSKILHKLNRSEKVFARKLTVVQIDNERKRQFLIDNHIQGDCASSINLALVDQYQIIYALATFGKSRFDKSYQWELLRVCSARNFAVVGGVSKLLKAFASRRNAGEKMISYCNLRFSTGNLYRSVGFEYVKNSAPNYFYVSQNGKPVGSRNQWQKHMLKGKLTNYDINLTEQENMRNHGYNRIWDCGNMVFSYTF